MSKKNIALIVTGSILTIIVGVALGFALIIFGVFPLIGFVLNGFFDIFTFPFRMLI